MKRHILFLAILAIIWIVPCYGDPIGRDKAVTIAGRFLRNGGSRTLDASLKVTNDVPGTKAPEEVPYFIIEDPAGGFVIVSNETAMVPILGYSYTGSAGTGMQMPPALKEWLEAVSETVSYARHSGIAASEATQRNWDRLSVATKSVAPVQPVAELQTAPWNQGYPFNILCPAINGSPAVTGCGPTATAIVMRYHKWPDYAVNVTVPEYEWKTENNTLLMRNGGWTIDYAWDWDAMPATDARYLSDEQADAIAVLMRDIGALEKATYEKSGTGIFMSDIDALPRLLGYNKDMHYISLQSHTREEFAGLIASEIRAGRPVIMGGRLQDKNSIHAYVADGVDAEGNIRMNWGWGGALNGYFKIFPYDWEEAHTIHDYFVGMEAWIDIRPDDGSALMEPEIYAHNLSFEEKEPDITRDFIVYVILWCGDSGFGNLHKEHDIEIAIGVRDREGNLIEIVSETIKPSNANYPLFKCRLNVAPKEESYLCVNYRYSSEEEWKEARYDLAWNSGRIYLNEPVSLESRTECHITRTKNTERFGWGTKEARVIKIRTVKGTSLFLYSEDGNLISLFNTAAWSAASRYVMKPVINDALYLYNDRDTCDYYIYLDDLPKGKYRVTLKKDLQQYEFSFEI